MCIMCIRLVFLSHPELHYLNWTLQMSPLTEGDNNYPLIQKSHKFIVYLFLYLCNKNVSQNLPMLSFVCQLEVAISLVK